MVRLPGRGKAPSLREWSEDFTQGSGGRSLAETPSDQRPQRNLKREDVKKCRREEADRESLIARTDVSSSLAINDHRSATSSSAPAIPDSHSSAMQYFKGRASNDV
jgi:hypothetical protein